MALGDLNGHGRVNVRSPTAVGVCDRCDIVWQLDQLSKQFEWQGAALVWTGYIVCKHCLDTPNEQNRVLILPGDPQPRVNPRPDFNVTGMAPATTPGNQGFSQYVLGVPTPGLYPTVKAQVLSQVAQVSGVPTQSARFDRSTIINPANTTINLLAAAPFRTWLLLYNPVQAQAQVSLQTALWGVTTNLILGPGEALFWATAQGFGPAYTGAMTLIGLTPSMPFWCWEAWTHDPPYLVTEDGSIITTESGIPITV